MTYAIREFNQDNHQIMAVYGYGIRDAAEMLDRVVVRRVQRYEKHYPIKGYDAYVSGWVFFDQGGHYTGYASLEGAY
jgi:hypothetical protein